MDGVSDEVELDSDVSSPEGGLCGSGNRHACLIVFANECWARRGMTKFGQQHAQEDCLCCCKAKGNIFCLSSGLGDIGLEAAAVRNGAAAHAEHIIATD